MPVSQGRAAAHNPSAHAVSGEDHERALRKLRSAVHYEQRALDAAQTAADQAEDKAARFAALAEFTAADARAAREQVSEHVDRVAEAARALAESEGSAE